MNYGIEEVDEINSAEYVEFKKVQYPNGDVYEGECFVSSGKRHGEGLYTYANGETFEGMYANDIRVQGKMTYRDGSTYQGEWLTIVAAPNNGEGGSEEIAEAESYAAPGREAGKQQSRWGWLNVFSWGTKAGSRERDAGKTGDAGQVPRRYVMRDGTGEYVYPSGDKYSGQWRKNKKHGAGYFFQKETGACYSGQWRDGEINGHGRWTLADGSALEANFVNGAPVGTVILVSGNGEDDGGGGRIVSGMFVGGCFVPTMDDEEGNDDKSETSKNSKNMFSPNEINQSRKYAYPKVNLDIDVNSVTEEDEGYKDKENAIEDDNYFDYNKYDNNNSYNLPPPLSNDTFSSSFFDADSSSSSSSSSATTKTSSSTSTSSSSPPPPPIDEDEKSNLSQTSSSPTHKKSKIEINANGTQSKSSKVNCYPSHSSVPSSSPPILIDDIPEISKDIPLPLTPKATQINGNEEEERKRGDLMKQIKTGFELRKTRDENGVLLSDVEELNENESEDEPDTDIVSQLKNAMIKRRTALNITNKGEIAMKDDDNSWSDE